MLSQFFIWKIDPQILRILSLVYVFFVLHTIPYFSSYFIVFQFRERPWPPGDQKRKSKQKIEFIYVFNSEILHKLALEALKRVKNIKI